MAQRLQLQLQALDGLRVSLQVFHSDIQMHLSQYKSILAELRQTGIPEEVIDNYEGNYATPKVNTLSSIRIEIESRDIPYVKKNLSAIERAIQAARS